MSEDEEDMTEEEMWDAERKDICACLVELLKRADVFRDRINDHDQLSAAAGLCLLELQGTCLISSAKIPMAGNLFLNMWFGSAIDDKTREIFCPASETNDRAVSRAADAERALRAFNIHDTDVNNPDRIISISLMMDEGNKKGLNMKAKLGNAMSASGEVNRLCFDTDRGLTKVTDTSAQQTFDSLVNELGDGVFLIQTVCSDWFANGLEAKKVGKLIDDKLRALGAITRETHPKLFIESTIDSSVVFDLSGPTREECVNACKVT